ncbi:tetratricopeptide repeat containing protein [Pseudohyphozyma bogoriensis]|nr:tetratricopeptide repeat containing protein [Pseudohyphozyma bogoriensis]
MFANAKRYNAPGSAIFLDAKALHKLLKDTYGVVSGGFVLPDDDDDDDLVISLPSVSRAPSIAPAPPATGTPSGPPKRGPTLKPWLTRKLQETMGLKGPGGRPYADGFKTLPDRSTWAEYYRVITNPMAFDVISNKINKRIYTTVQQFVDDVNVLFANAEYFNEESSQIWQDARAMKLHFVEVMKEVPPVFVPPRTYNTARRRAEQAAEAEALAQAKAREGYSLAPESPAYESGQEDDYDGSYGAGTPSFGAPTPLPFDLTGGADPFAARSRSETPATGRSPSISTTGLPVVTAPYSIPPIPTGSEPFSVSPAYQPPPSAAPLHANGHGVAPPAPTPQPEKPRFVAKLSSAENLPSMLHFLVRNSPTAQPLTLNNALVRQHSFAVPRTSERIDFSPVYRKTTSPAFDAPEPRPIPAPSVKLNIRPVGTHVDTLAEVPSVDGPTHRYSVIPRPGLTVLEWMDAPGLKEQGNVAFAAGDWATALGHYTEALATASSLSKEDLAALYSNRCASYIHLYNLDLALLDAEKTIELRPTWSRGYARQGECYSFLGDFAASTAAYNLAVKYAEDEATTARFQTSLATLQKRERTVQHLKQTPVSINYVERIETLEKEGKTDFVVGGAAELVFAAYGWCEEGMQKMDKDVKGNIREEFSSQVPSGILTVVDAILACPLSFHIPPGADPSEPLGNKIPLQYQYDIQVFKNERYLLGELSADEIIEEFATRMPEDGWTKVRSALAHLVRGQILMAFVEEATGAYLALEEGYSNAATPADREKFDLGEIQANAEELMDDCIANPTTQDPDNATHWLSFQIMPLVHAAKAIAFVLFQRSQQAANMTLSGKAIYLHPEMSLAAGQMYGQAAVYLPMDDPDKPVCMFLSLSCALRGGGLTISQVFTLAAEAEKATPVSEPVFGPVPRDFPARVFVRQCCADLRALLQSEKPPSMEAVLKPIPKVVEKHLEGGKTLADVVDPAFYKEMKGDVGLWETVSE